MPPAAVQLGGVLHSARRISSLRFRTEEQLVEVRFGLFLPSFHKADRPYTLAGRYIRRDMADQLLPAYGPDSVLDT
jgi:hypothetical protein